eukprot:407777_1
MSVYAISSAALSHLRPLVVNIVDQNVKEIRRSSHYMDSPEEQKHLSYIADTMESSVETATRALDCKDIISSIKVKSTSNPSLTHQLDEILKKQSEILQISANSLLNSKKHYSQQFMPGGLSNTAPTPKSLAYSDATADDINTPNNNDNTPKCKDTDKATDTDSTSSVQKMDLQQIFSKLQVSIQSINETNRTRNTVVIQGTQQSKNSDCKEDSECDDNNKFEAKRIWVKTMVVATHFVTAVWLAMKHDIEGNDNTNSNTPK